MRESSIRLLLVEDNPGDAFLLANRIAGLTDPHLELIHVARIADALSRLAQDPEIDAVLLDLGLPDSQGVDSVKQVLGARPDIPIVVLTGLDSDEVGIQAVKQGAEDYLVKGDLEGLEIARSVLYAIERSRLKAQVRLIVMRNADAMVVVGDDQRIRYVNRAATQLFERSQEDLVGSTFPYSLEYLSAAEIQIARENDEPRICEMRLARIDWDGELAYLASIRDVTDLRRAHDLEQQLLHADRLASIGQLAAGVAHEINNPITYVGANVEMLGDTLASLSAGLDQLRARLEALGQPAARAFDESIAGSSIAEKLATGRELVEECADGSRRIASIVKDLAWFARIERDEISWFEINEAVEVACHLTAAEIRRRARLVKTLGSLPPIAAERARLTHALVNILVNAAQAIPAGDPDNNQITVETFERAGTLVIAISDTGCGISTHHLGRLFEPFFTTKPRGEGTGLGLPIAAETIRKHGGEVEVTSEVGAGTRFEIILPRSTRWSDDVDPPSPRERVGGDAPLRILVIDDEVILLRSLRRVLQTRHQVVTIASGQEALDLLASDDAFDVILCDMMMPLLDGPAVYNALRERRPDLADRMVFLTGGVFNPRTEEFVGRHEPLILEKPIGMAELLRVVQEAAARP